MADEDELPVYEATVTYEVRVRELYYEEHVRTETRQETYEIVSMHRSGVSSIARRKFTEAKDGKGAIVSIDVEKL